ncbi:MAG: hypothetical protein JST65_00940 [Acidobacteria bacterium]|nr:hypothetical protein [Acidobacteriota bacterium]
MTLIEELDAVLEKDDARPHYDAEFVFSGADFLRDNADTLRAALKLYEAAKVAPRGRVYGDGAVRIDGKWSESLRLAEVIIISTEVLK